MGRSGPSRVGTSNTGRGPRYAPSTTGNRGFASHMPSILETNPQNTSTSRISSGKFEVLDGLLEDKAAWKTKNDSKGDAPQVERESEDGLTKSMASLAMSTASKADSTVPEWRREGSRPEKYISNPAGSRAQSGLMRKPDLFGRTLVPTASRVSCTFTRTRDQPRMAEAGFLNYYPFHKHEFALGIIIRGVIHEQDIMNTPRPAPSNAPTAITNAGKEHVTHGDFGPVYSENRILIVVNNRPGDHYLAVPVYSHKGNGLAKKLHRDEYVSVADHRYLANCQQQSAHAPLVTEFLKDGVEELLPVSAAYASYPVSRKYGLPVAHQGRLDDESTKRLVAMYLKWGKPYENED